MITITTTTLSSSDIYLSCKKTIAYVCQLFMNFKITINTGPYTFITVINTITYVIECNILL